MAIEEFVEGHEGFYDTLAVNGRVAFDFISHYYPNVLEAMRTRWISPQIVATNRIHEPGYDEVKEMGARVIAALGIGTSATHMEWFFGPKGLKFSEIGCRPPGVGQWDSYCAAGEFDLYREWAIAVCHGTIDRAPSRPLRLRHHRAAPGPGRPHRRLRGDRRGLPPLRRPGGRGSTSRRRGRRRSRSRPATWRTPGCGSATRTSTSCGGS